MGILISFFFQALCLKHGVKYHESKTLWEALGKYISHLTNMGRKPVKSE